MLLCTDGFVKLLQCTLYGIELLCFAMHSIVENFKSQNTAQKSLPPRESASRTSVKNI